MRGKICRGLRLELVAGLGIALAMPVLSLAAVSAQGVATQTALTVSTSDHGGRTLADGTINAQYVAVSLVEDGVQRNGRLARLPVSENQFTLATPDGNERINDHEAGLKRDCDWRSIHDGRRRPLDRQSLVGSHWAIAIKRTAERINDPPE